MKKQETKRKSRTRQLEDELQEKESQFKDCHERYLRALADLDNFKKRMMREKEEYMKYANETLIKALLSVLDNFERAIDASKISNEFQAFHKGVEMIYGQLKEILEAEGLRQFSSLGEPFDPEKHEAVVALESNDHPPNTVVDEMEKGYTLKERVIRPAKVAVSKNMEKEVDEDAESDRN